MRHGAGGDADDEGDPLAPMRLAAFTATLAGLAPAEVRKAKELLVRNAIADLRAQRAEQTSSTWAAAIHWLIPIFWPMLFSMRRSMKIEAARRRERLLNALDVWKDDLRGETFELPGGETIRC